jgi:hypothetical protein
LGIPTPNLKIRLPWLNQDFNFGYFSHWSPLAAMPGIETPHADRPNLLGVEIWEWVLGNCLLARSTNRRSRSWASMRAPGPAEGVERRHGPS